MNYFTVIFICMMFIALAGCQTKDNIELPKARDNRAAIAKLQTINSHAQTCWVKSKDKAFRSYRVIPELDTRTGKPRILVVQAKSSQGLPQYVIEADGTPARVSTYGPLHNKDIGRRIDADVMRWNNGGKGCTA